MFTNALTTQTNQDEIKYIPIHILFWLYFKTNAKKIEQKIIWNKIIVNI